MALISWQFARGSPAVTAVTSRFFSCFRTTTTATLDVAHSLQLSTVVVRVFFYVARSVQLGTLVARVFLRRSQSSARYVCRSRVFLFFNNSCSQYFGDLHLNSSTGLSS